MTQIPIHPTVAAHDRSRGAAPRFRQWSDAAQRGIDWRRALSLHRRLLAGDLAVIGDAARTESDTAPALSVLLMGMIASGLGAFLWMIIESGGSGVGGAALRVMLFGTLASLAAWTLWFALTRYALRSIFEIDVHPRALLRALAVTGGFAVWHVFLVVGPASFAVGLLATVAMALLAVIAVRAAAPEADDRAAVISTAFGFGAYAIALAVIADLTGAAAGVFIHATG